MMDNSGDRSLTRSCHLQMLFSNVPIVQQRVKEREREKEREKKRCPYLKECVV